MAQARTARTIGIPILITTENGTKLLLERAGGPDIENIDGPEQFLILEQRQRVEVLRLHTTIRETI